MIPGSKTEFDRYTADEKRELYKTDPELFNKLAAEAISQACIGETPEGTLKLLQMQRTIDTLLQNAKTQPERMKRMENIFYSQVFGREGNLARLVDACEELAHVGREAEKVPAGKPTLYVVKK